MKRRELKNVALIVALAVVVVLFTVLTDGSFLSARNLSNLLRQISVNGILAIGMTLVILTGGIDLSIGSVLAFTGVLAGFSQAHWGWSETGASGALGSMSLALVGSFATGLTNGVLIGYVGIPAFVISLGMMVIARGLAFIISDGQTQSPIGDFFLDVGRRIHFSPSLPCHCRCGCRRRHCA
jgi:D-xylose transport system permease protein